MGPCQLGFLEEFLLTRDVVESRVEDRVAMQFPGLRFEAVAEGEIAESDGMVHRGDGPVGAVLSVQQIERVEEVAELALLLDRAGVLRTPNTAALITLR